MLSTTLRPINWMPVAIERVGEPDHAMLSETLSSGDEMTELDVDHPGRRRQARWSWPVLDGLE